MIRLNNVRFAYNKQHNLFYGLNLELNCGGIYGLLGKNGAGKSTLLKLISGVIFPDSGTINVFNNNSEKRNKIVLQETFLFTEDNIKHTLSCEEYLTIYSELYPRFDKVKFNTIIKEWQIQIDNKLAELSEGERKKFFIAFGLSTNCRLLLLDEPTNGLDIPSKIIFRKLIAGNADKNTLIIISSHQVRDLEDLIDPVIIIDNGKVLLNQRIANIEDKIHFGMNRTIPTDQNILYSMHSIAGYVYASVRKKDTTTYGTKVDLELLFNLVINNPLLINELFGE